MKEHFHQELMIINLEHTIRKVPDVESSLGHSGLIEQR